MAVEPNNFIEFARWSQNKGDEIGLRNAASRAYYAAFHACREAAHGTLAVPSDAGGTHAEIISAYEQAGDRGYKKIGYMLRQCRDFRTKADYRIKDDFDSAYAVQAISQTERIIELIIS